eukprot:7959230-Heterocapsa_arctica.AAC.1
MGRPLRKGAGWRPEHAEAVGPGSGKEERRSGRPERAARKNGGGGGRQGNGLDNGRSGGGNPRWTRSRTADR